MGLETFSLAKVLSRNLIGRAFTCALQSRDPSTQVGAVFMSKHGEIVGGCNRVHGSYDPEKLKDRDWKLANTTHAELDAILNAGKHGLATKDGILAATWGVCSRCARDIVASGIRGVVSYKQSYTPDRWKDDIALAMEILKDEGVGFLEIADYLDCEFKLRFNGGELLIIGPAGEPAYAP